MNYHTKQREAIAAYMASLDGGHVTAAQIAAHFEHEAVSIGRTTIYRHLDQLAAGGKVRKFKIDGVPGACFQFVDHSENCQAHMHLKCESCGELVCLSCGMLDEIRRHFLDSHTFRINTMKSVLYGKCKSCL